MNKEKPVIERQLALAGIQLWKALHEVAQHLDSVKEVKMIPAEKITEVTLDDRNNHVGETVHVCAKVYGVKYLTSGGKPTFVKVGASYPNSPLTLLIWQDIRDSFSYQPEKLDGKNICVIGKLELYKGKPEIVIKKERNIELN